ncbi:phage tail tape measure protein [Amorphus orientalis]|uniref:TP901 family phage tail tape measure protein n=1 Tax=Amorphus orientalis TaxID=649198 RepID=A0AAE4AS50_9HYPH|nr:phage tail tape measure protein [Amorphus orientalis]MDQ0314863.1 TP901 family phage tail tape measure protein [Amorphus orientalis]
MTRLVSELVVSVTDRATGPSRQIAQTVARLKDAAARNTVEMERMRGQLIGAAAAGYGLYRALKAPLAAAVEFESAMADVRKVVDFPTPDAFSQMSADIVTMSTRIPIAATGIASIVAAAGQAGMAGDELLAFTEVAAKVGVAFDMTAGQTGEALAKIKTQLQLSVADTSALADAINHLSNTSASAAPDLIDYMNRVAAAGEQYGFTAEETAAIGSAMIASGAQANVAATSFRNVGRALSKGVAATNAQRDAFARLGLSATDVAKSMQDDAVGTLREVIVRIRELPEHLQATTLSQLFGDEARALAPLVTQLELYDTALASVAQKANYLGSAEKEYAARAATTANNWQLFQNKAEAAAIAIGSALLPAMNGLMDALGPVIMDIVRFAQENPELTRTVVALSAGLIGLRVAAIAARFSMLWMKGGVLSAAIVGLRGLGGAVNGTATALRAMRSAATGGQARRLAVDAAANAKALWEQRQAAFASAVHMRNLAKAGQVAGLSLPDATKAVSAAAKEATEARVALAAANAQLRATGPAARLAAAGLMVARGAMTALKLALISTGVGAILVGIATAGVWIYRNWSGIKEMFVGIGEGIKSAFPGAGDAIDAVSSAVGTLIGWLEQLTAPVDATSEEWRAFGVRVGETIGQVIADVAALPGRLVEILGSIDLVTIGRQIMDGLLAGIKAGASAVLDYVSNFASRIRSSVSGAVSGAVGRLKTAVGLGAGNTPPGRARGGPVSALRPYIVGERGPELFVPSVGGRIIANDDLVGEMRSLGSAFAGGRGYFREETTSLPRIGPAPGSASRRSAPSGPAVSIGEVHIHAAPGMDEREVARLAVEEIGRRVRDGLSGIQADIEWGGA